MLFRTLGLILICCSVLQACETGVDKEEVDPQHLQGIFKPDPIQITGRVNKGAVSNATVSLYSMESGSPDFSSALATVTTVGDGSFAMPIENEEYFGIPALLRVQVDASASTMVCDLPRGCGDGVFFGDDIPALAESFELMALVPQLTRDTEYNITLLTHIAYELFQQQGSGGDVVLGIYQANTKVASRFGVIGDLGTLDVIDITNHVEWRTTSSRSLRYSALGGAMLQVMRDMNSEITFSSAVSQIARNFADRGLVGHLKGLDNVNQLTYKAILVELMAIIELIRDTTDQDSMILDDLLTEVSTEHGLALLEDAGVYSQGVSSDSSHLTEVEKAKTMVEKVRETYSSLDLRTIAGLSDVSKLFKEDDPLSGLLEGFGIELDFAELISGDESGYVLDAFADVLMVMLEVVGAHESMEEFSSESNIQVDHEYLNDIHHMSISQQLNVCEEEIEPCVVQVDLSMEVEIAGAGVSPVLNEYTADFLSVKINGDMKSGGLRISLTSDSPQISVSELVLRLPNDNSEMNGQINRLIFFDAEPLRISAPIQMIRQTETELTGVRIDVDANIDLVSVDWDTESFSYEVGENKVTEESQEYLIRKLKGLDVNVGAQVRSATQNFLASLNFKQPGPGFAGRLSVLRESEKVCPLGEPEEIECETGEASTRFEGETADNFVAFTASVGYKANLKAIPEPVIVQVSGARASNEENKINSLKLFYPGHALSLFGTFNSGGGIVTMRGSNLDGVELKVDSNENRKRYGTIFGPSGEKVADIKDMGDWVKVMYIDDYFVAL